MSNIAKVLIGMCVFAALLFGINIMLDNNKKIDYTKENEINLLGDSIPTVYSVLGDKTISKSKNGIDSTGTYIDLTYTNITLMETSTYIGELISKGYLLIESDTTTAVLANESKDAGKIITINVFHSNQETNIKYSKTSGTVTRD